MLLGLSLLGFAQSKKDTVCLARMQLVTQSNEEEKNETPKRIPSAPIMVEIDFEGLTVHFSNGLPTDSIISYELCDSDLNPIIVHSGEAEFVEALLHIESGVYTIRFETQNYIVIGEIYL